MKCPYCLEGFHESDKLKTYSIRWDNDKPYEILEWICPSCEKCILHLSSVHYLGNRTEYHLESILKPKWINRKPLPDFIDDKFKSDFIEASNVLHISPKASAALSRRCLQLILREKWGFNQRDLADQIQAAVDGEKLPGHISESLDAIRNIWNFAAHPNKSKHTGEILEVEPWEAEWSLDVLEGIFDYYFIQPELVRKKKEALNKKLVELWKPEMK